ncbi:MAG: glutaredoxin family protein [Acidobacteriota bacterium]
MKRRLFTLPGCPHCERARAFLAERQVPYVEYDVSISEEARRLMLTLTGRTEVPALIAGYQAAVGFNRDTWARLLRHAEQVDRVDPYKLPPDLGDDPYNRD